MQFCNNPKYNDEAVFVVNKVKKQSKVLASVVSCAYNLFFEKNPNITQIAEKTLDQTFVMCKYMDPDVEDVIAMLLAYDRLMNKINQRDFLAAFGTKRYDQYFQCVTSACAHAPKIAERPNIDSIRHYIMMRVCDKMFKRCNKTVNHNSSASGAGISQNAYEILKKLYGRSTRITGEPYIVPQICVATLLAEYGADSKIIVAALLQNVTVNTNYTVDDIERDFGKKVAQYVEALSLAREASLENCRMVDARPVQNYFGGVRLANFVKAIVNNFQMIPALYVKAANIMYELSLTESVSDLEKYDEENAVQREYLPLLKRFKLKYFVRKVEDLIWRASDVERYENIERDYGDLVSRNWESIDRFVARLASDDMIAAINTFAGLLDCGECEVEIKKQALCPKDVYTRIISSEESSAFSYNRISKKTVPICNIDIILSFKDLSKPYSSYVSCFLKAFESKTAGRLAEIVDFYKDDGGQVVFEIEDRYRCIFRCRLMTRSDYLLYKTGVEIKDDDVQGYLSEDKRESIKVFLRNGKPLYLPVGSTVIDVAFAIHEEVGYTVKSALINGRRVSIYKQLAEGDSIIVEADTYREDRVTKKFISHVRFDWIKRVATIKARDMIIDFLKDTYEGEDPQNDSAASTEVVDASADKLLVELRPE